MNMQQSNMNETITSTCTHYGFYIENTLAMKINVLACVIMVSIALLPTILLNGTILIIFLQKRCENKTTNALLINLVMTDLLSGCFTNPFIILEYLLVYNGKDPCKFSHITHPTSIVLASVSFTTLSTLAIDRYMQFCHPFKYEDLQTRNVVWPIIVLLWLMPLYPVLRAAITKDMAVLDVYVMIIGVIVIIINSTCYSMMYHLVRKHRRQIHADAARLGNDQAQTPDNRIALVVVLLFILTFICYLPMVILSALSAATNRENKRLAGYLSYWAWMLAALNSTVNPILKFYRLESVRTAFTEFWKQRFNSPTNTITVQQASARNKETGV
eukprot:Seg1862.2 transcript_id=Seg1862.2/GoldUCD/mRNA.D3Y31 product="G-protein coupled receptor GRL101" protein_id=Seg1862.2/GoldUCD/D3Y31